MPRRIAIACLASVFAACCVPRLIAEPVDVAAQRSRLELASIAQEPQGVMATVAELKAKKTAPGELPSQEVTIVGQIGGMPNPWNDTHPDFPWFAGQASFFLLDAKTASQFAKHAKSHGDNHNCAFCQRLAAKNAHNIAIVNLVDENGEILKIDARRLLGLRENQRVIIHGRAELLGGTMLVIHADGVHFRR